MQRDSGNRGGDFVGEATRHNAGEHLSKQLKAEIKNKYNIKTNIIGLAACSLAMHLDFTERAKGTHKLNTGHGRKTTTWGDNGVRVETKKVQFAEGFMYGGQGKHLQALDVEICTKKQSSHHAGSLNHATAATA